MEDPKKTIHGIAESELNFILSCDGLGRYHKNSNLRSNFLGLKTENDIFLFNQNRQEDTFWTKSRPMLDKRLKKETYKYDLSELDSLISKSTSHLNFQPRVDKSYVYCQIVLENLLRLASVDLNVCEKPSPFISDTTTCHLQVQFDILNPKSLPVTDLGGATSP